MGSTQQLTVTGTFSDGTTHDITTQVTWSSSNPAAATISTSGLATAVAAGTTTITATSGTVSGSTILTVGSATLSSIAVTPANPNVTGGATQQFTATGTFSDGTTQDITSSVTWTSSNPAAATISTSG
ncbi:MAG: Ig-like domain-containing protein, partial [Dehalococcoidia bacterium]